MEHNEPALKKIDLKRACKLTNAENLAFWFPTEYAYACYHPSWDWLVFLKIGLDTNTPIVLRDALIVMNHSHTASLAQLCLDMS